MLKHAVAEAGRRGHAQATPLHVAATLLGAPGSPFRRACLQTHPLASHAASHLPHCRGLELCFNIALERLQAAQGPVPGCQPSYSNALVAALKRAQAHQRRGCPEQQQQPLLAVKVELEQLLISILDDPSVARVMREAGFSSTDVKNHLEETVSLTSSRHSATISSADQARLSLGAAIDHMGLRLGAQPSFLGNIALPQHLSQYNGLSLERNDTLLRLRPPKTASLYMNPRLHKPGSLESFLGGGDDLKRVFEVLVKRKRRNPVLVGDLGTCVEAVIGDLRHRLERGDVPQQLQGVKFLPAQLSFVSLLTTSKDDLERKFIDLNNAVNDLMPGGAIIYLGDLQWLLETSPLKGLLSRPSTFSPMQYVATEMRQLLTRHLGSGRIWLIGTATSHTYLGCQVEHPILESQWELQPVHIDSPNLSSSLPSRYKSQESGINAVDSSLTLSLHPSTAALKLNRSDDEEGPEKLNCCSDCMGKYEREALLLRGHERHGQSESPQSCSSSVETSSKDIDGARPMWHSSIAQPVLPLWLQKALLTGSSHKSDSPQAKEKTVPLNQTLLELKKKWNHYCRHVHQHLTSSNISSEKLQQPSPSSSQISGGTSSKCQEQSVMLLRSRPTGAIPDTGQLSAVGSCHPFGVLGSSLPISILQNGLGEHQQQIIAHKERVQDSTGCCNPKKELPWQVSTVVSPTVPSTEAATPEILCDTVITGRPTRMFRQTDPDALKCLCQGLAERVGWQKGIISTIANTVMQCRSNMGKRRGVCLKGDVWLLFLGYDQDGKKKMAEALAELIWGCEKKPICVTLGQQDLGSPLGWSLGLHEQVLHSGRKLPLDRLAEAVRHNPFSVLLLEDVDQADSMFKSSLLRAMEKGRLLDSSGRDVSFSNVIVVMTASVGTDCCDPGSRESDPGSRVSEKQLAEKEITIDPQRALRKHTEDISDTNNGNGHVENGDEQSSFAAFKRKAEWNIEDEPRDRSLGCMNKKTNLGRALALDLNISVVENASVECLTTSHKTFEDGQSDRLSCIEEKVLLTARQSMREFCDLVDAAVFFRPRV